jgi:hypothetical protein
MGTDLWDGPGGVVTSARYTCLLVALRFWSLKTCRSNCFQGRSFHPYIGFDSVFIASELLTCVFIFPTVVPTSAYPLAFPGALATSAIPPHCSIRSDSLLIVSTTDESHHEVTSFLISIVCSVRVILSTGFVWK